MEEPIRIGVEDFELEALWKGGKGEPVVACHPHPLHGGNLHNNVVEAVLEAAWNADRPTLRFNFRGAGSSGGVHGGGEDETVDVAAALVEATSRAGVGTVALAGYSFGSYVAWKYLLKEGAPEVSSFICIAPPAGMHPLVGWPEKPTLLLVGTLDAFCPEENARAIIEGLPEGSVHKLFQGVDHFFGGAESLVTRSVGAWLKT